MINKCQNCGKDTKNPKYCSRSCAATITGHTHPKRKLTRLCRNCNKIIVRNYRSLLCENCYNNKFDIENRTLSYYYTQESLKNLHKSSKAVHVRGLAQSKFKHLKALPCYSCGYDKHVELCHIKPISSFDVNSLIKDVNCEENIVQLCPNCHWEFDNGLLILDFPEQPESQ